MEQGDTSSQYSVWDTITSVLVKLSLFVDFVHFISPKHIFYFNVDEEASVLGNFVPQTPYQGSAPEFQTRLAAVSPADGQYFSSLRTTHGYRC